MQIHKLHIWLSQGVGHFLLFVLQNFLDIVGDLSVFVSYPEPIWGGIVIDKSITININHVNVINCIDQSIKIDTHNSSGNYGYRYYRFY